MTTPIFPVLSGINFPAKRTAHWSTNVQAAVSGKETRIQLWTYPQYSWELGYDFLRADPTDLEFQTLLGFFNQMAGQAQVFLYPAPNDNSVTGQGVGAGDGSTTSFQLVRVLGGSVEPIFAPNAVTQVTVAGVPVSAGSYTVNAYGSAAPGTLVFATAPSAGQAIAVSYSYYFPCRFTTDTLEFDLFMSQLYSAQKVGFQSVK